MEEPAGKRAGSVTAASSSFEEKAVSGIPLVLAREGKIGRGILRPAYLV